MCDIVKELPTNASPPASGDRALLNFSLGKPTEAGPGNWIRNTSKTKTFKIHCCHKFDGRSETHSLAPGEALVCEDEAVLTFAGQEEPCAT